MMFSKVFLLESILNTHMFVFTDTDVLFIRRSIWEVFSDGNSFFLFFSPDVSMYEMDKQFYIIIRVFSPEHSEVYLKRCSVLKYLLVFLDLDSSILEYQCKWFFTILYWHFFFFHLWRYCKNDYVELRKFLLEFT